MFNIKLCDFLRLLDQIALECHQHQQYQICFYLAKNLYQTLLSHELEYLNKHLLFIYPKACMLYQSSLFQLYFFFLNSSQRMLEFHKINLTMINYFLHFSIKVKEKLLNCYLNAKSSCFIQKFLADLGLTLPKNVYIKFTLPG